MTEEEKKIEDVFTNHRDFIFDSSKLMLEHINEVVEDLEIRKQLIEESLKERQISLYMMLFVMRHIEQFVEFCRTQNKK